jgi:uncharacterized protein YbjT (DUF2867 family)
MKVLLTGATGFVGTEILKQLLTAGHQVRVISRDANPTLPSGVEALNGNIIHAPSISGCMDGMEAVVHIVGVITEVGENTYDRVHRVGTQNVINEAKKAKVKRFVHMSSLGTRDNAKSQYHQSKWAAEELVRASGLDWTIFRPSVIYGKNDDFTNLFAKMMKFPLNVLQLFTVPLINGGNNLLQPIPVGDVATCFVGALNKPESIKKTYDLCGPRALPMKEVLKKIAEAVGQDTMEVHPPCSCSCGLGHIFTPFSILKGFFVQPKVLLVETPLPVAKLIATTMETFSSKPQLNRDQLIMIQEDNVGNPAEAAKDFGINPPEFEQGLASYLKH